MRAPALAGARWPLRRKGANPYAEMSVTDAIAALPDEATAAPTPTFTARQYDPARVTMPIPGLAARPMPANAAVPRPAPRPAGAPDLAVLRRVRDGLLDRWRAEAFVADKRELPCFDAVTRAEGWQGLHVRYRPRHQRWTTERWLVQALAETARQTEAARRALYQEIGEARARVLAPQQQGGAR